MSVRGVPSTSERTLLVGERGSSCEGVSHTREAGD